MIRFDTLEGIPVTMLAQVFNEAFSDYIVKLQVTEEALAARIMAEGLDPACSVGAFHGDKLAGFILQGRGDMYGRKTWYNGGTGVIPAYRGQKITAQMYRWIFQMPGAAGVEQYLLEVISTNEKAIKAYTSTGFGIRRSFNCFKGIVTIRAHKTYTLAELPAMPVFNTADFWNAEPSWQHTIASVARGQSGYKIIAVYEGDDLAGYIVFAPATGRIKQLAVRKGRRRNGIGRALLQAAAGMSESKEMTVINVDSRDAATTAFFKACGLQCFIQQYEMVLSR